MVLYCIDTSSLLEAWARHYPISAFPSLWEKFDQLIEDDRLISSEEVLQELSKKDDDLHNWAKERATMFKPLREEVQNMVLEVLGDFPRLVDTRRGRSGADPFVIAEAYISKCTLITYGHNIRLGR